jgi:hypothetical protein
MPKQVTTVPLVKQADRAATPRSVGGERRAGSGRRRAPRRLAATRRLGPGPSMVTTERGRRLQPEHASVATPDSPEEKPLWLRPMVVPFADTAGRPDPGPPGRVAARRTDALHESPMQTPRRRTGPGRGYERSAASDRPGRHRARRPGRDNSPACMARRVPPVTALVLLPGRMGHERVGGNRPRTSRRRWPPP